jgi:septal ring factor EnvC (AmiA/AmiB activator)
MFTNELKNIYQQFQGNKVLTAQEMNSLCKDAFRVLTSYFSMIEDNITKALLNRNEVSNSNARNQAIIACSSSQYVDFMKEVLPCQHFTMLTSKIDQSISSNRANINALMEKINGRIQATEDEIEAFDKIIASQMKKRDALKSKLDALYKSKTQLTKNYNHIDQISSSIDDL